MASTNWRIFVMANETGRQNTVAEADLVYFKVMSTVETVMVLSWKRGTALCATSSTRLLRP